MKKIFFTLCIVFFAGLYASAQTPNNILKPASEIEVVQYEYDDLGRHTNIINNRYEKIIEYDDFGNRYRITTIPHEITPHNLIEFQCLETDSMGRVIHFRRLYFEKISDIPEDCSE